MNICLKIYIVTIVLLIYIYIYIYILSLGSYMIHAFDERFRRLKWAMFSIDFEVFCLGVHVLPMVLKTEPGIEPFF